MTTARTGGEDLRQVSLRRLAEFDIAPKRSLGQNFLIDDNILDVILDRLEATAADVGLEVGAGLGVLTKALAESMRFVHAFEVDAALEPALRETLAHTRNVGLHMKDVLRGPLEELEPAPTVCASNLPYSVAGPFIAEAVGRLPGVRRYCLMVQREVAARIAAPPGSREYGGISAWVQLHVEVDEKRALSRNIFHPRPRVDSTLLVLSRRPAGAPGPGLDSAPGTAPDRAPALDPQASATVRQTIDAAFSQRRKTLENSLAAALGLEKERVRRALEACGIPPQNRAEQVPPEEFLSLARILHEEVRGEGDPDE